MPANLEINASGDINEKLFKLEQQNQRLIQQNRELASASKKGFDDVSGSIESGVRNLLTMSAGLLSVGSVMATVSSATEEWIGHLKEAESVQARIRGGIADLYGTTKLMAQAPEVESFLGSVKGLSREQAGQLFSGIAKADPQAGLSKLKAMTTATAPMFPLIEGDIQGFGAFAGEIGKLMPGLKPEQAVNVAIAAKQEAGQFATNLTSPQSRRALGIMTQAGMNQEEALSNLIEDYQVGDRRGGTMIKAVEAAYKPEQIHVHGRPLTKDERVKKEFAHAPDFNARMDLLRKDEKFRNVIMGEQALLFAQMNPEEIAKINANLGFAEGPGFQEKQIAQMRTSDVMRKERGGMIISEAGKPGEEMEKDQAYRLGQQDKMFQNIYMPQMSNVMERWGAQFAWNMSKKFHPENPIEAFTLNKSSSEPGRENPFYKLYQAGQELEREIAESKKTNEILSSIDKKLSNPAPAAVQGNRNQHGEK